MDCYTFKTILTAFKFALYSDILQAIIFIIFAALLDALDGRIARLIKGTSEFGKELDSLTDFVSFGIAPAFIIYFWELNNYGKIGWAITLIYSVCCVLRLARFNLTKVSEKEEWKLNFFEGIPSPAGGILILLPLIYELSSYNINLEVIKLTPYFTIIIAFLLISKIPTLSLKKISIAPKLTVFILLSIGIIFVLLLFFTFETLLILGLIYLITLPITTFIYFRQSKKSVEKNFEDEHEDIL